MFTTKFSCQYYKIFTRRQLMKKITLLLLLIIIFVLANCQDKSTPQKQPAFQGQKLAVENEVGFLQDMVTNNPDNINAWIKLGNVFMDTQQYNKAIDAYQKALEINPDITNVRVDMGTCYRRIGRPDKAIEEYKKAIAKDPTHPNAHRNMGIVLGFDLGQKDQAIKELQEYLRLFPQAPDRDNIRQAIERLSTA